MSDARKLLEAIFNVTTEATDPRDVERELNTAQSLRGGPRTEPGVRKWQDRFGKKPRSVAVAQSDIDSARSVFAKDEAAEGASGLRITGDPATLEMLGQAIELLAKYGADDDAEWADDALQAMRGAKDGNVTLPSFKATPGLDSFNDDMGTGPEEDY